MVARNEFLLSIRESGYRGLEWALAELVDNSLEAAAKNVQIYLPGSANPFGEETIAVRDDGCGMSKREALSALTFGGSSRYGSRGGMGRFGMGLPCSSLSQARRVEIISRGRDRVRSIGVLFDLDDALSGKQCPSLLSGNKKGKLLLPTGGTVVIWANLDRVDVRSWPHKAANLRKFLSRKYRSHLLNGAVISVDGERCSAFDPLLRSEFDGIEALASPWGPPMIIHLSGFSHPVIISFSLLHVENLSPLSTEEKKRRGIIGKAGVSVVRAGREIDYGWFFIDRRRENYDDWWRAEVAFHPEHDELFGVSYTKQGVRPTEIIRVALSPHLTAASKELQRLVREAHATLVLDTPLSRATACAIASETDEMLCPIDSQNILARSRNTTGRRYSVESRPLASHRFVEHEFSDGHVRVVVNECHRFYQFVYAPALRGELSIHELSVRLELMLIGFARANIVVDLCKNEYNHDRFLDELSRNIKHLTRSLR